MIKSLSTILTVCFAMTIYAEPKIEGTASELSKYLNGVSSEVSIKTSSKVLIKSDRAVLNFVVSSTEDTLKEAIEDNIVVLGRISTELAEKGIDRSSISAKSFSSLPGYSFYSKKPTSYTTKKTVAVKIDSENELLTALGVLEDYSKQTRFLKLTFEFLKKEKIENDLLAENLKKAAEKKALYEKALGVKLRVKKFIEGKTANDFPSYRAPAAQTYFSSSMTKTGSDKIQWQLQDQNQKGFSEYVIERELEIVYAVED